MELPEKKLSDAELDIMLAIWQSPPPVQRADLEEQHRRLPPAGLGTAAGECLPR